MLKNVTNLDACFDGCTNFNGDISKWDTTNVISMAFMFNNCTSFNQNIGSWNLTNVTDISNMLDGTFFSISNMNAIVLGWSNSQPLNTNINFSNNRTSYSNQEVINFGYSENEANTLTYDVSDKSTILLYNIKNDNTEITLPINYNNNMEVYDNSYDGTPLVVADNKITLNAGIHNIYVLNTTNIEWQRPTNTISLESLIDIKDTRALTLPQNNTTIGYFQNCTNLIWTATDGINLNTTSLSRCFYNCTSFNGNISNWNVLNVTNMISMFYNCTSFNQPLDFDTTNVIYMNSMFYNCTSFNQSLDLDTTNVTIINGMFYNCTSFNQPLDFNTSNVTNMNYMFSYCTSFNQPLDWDTFNVTNMNYMFSNCTSFNQPLDFDTSNVTNMDDMFSYCTSFNQPLDFDTSNVTSMSFMFYNCTSFNQPLDFNTSKVTDMRYMFYNCTSFDQNISEWDIFNVDNFNNFCFGVTISEENYDNILISWVTKVKQINELEDQRTLHFGNSVSSINDTIKRAYSDINYKIIDGGPDFEGISPQILLEKNKFIFIIVDSIMDFNGQQSKLLTDYIATKNTSAEINKVICTFINN
uniref:BspA family leucine-rich repeat surface protein n=1 Tax=viral metagenome TaxID=1070528 RepID=A0A6C0ADJ7_9ZZZZ